LRISASLLQVIRKEGMMELAIKPICASSFSDLVEIPSITELKNRRSKLAALKERYLASSSLYEFFKAAWLYIEGNMPYVDSWHIEAIAEHLEAVYARQIKKLIINVPPRTGKTNLISVAFPAWVWIHNPSERFLTVSCVNSLSLEHAQKNRSLLESNWYQDNWGYRFPLLKDQNVKSFFQNTKTGYRQSTSVVSKTVGKGGSIIIIDDPNDLGDLSEIKRENVINWWTQRMSTRSNNPANDCRIVVQQRTHENDLTGYIRKNDSEGDWVELVLPLEFEEKRKCITVPLGIDQVIWEDPRNKEGELLSSLRFGEKQVNELKKLLGSYGYAGQCQQRPSPIGGGIIKKKWFKLWTSPIKPKFDYILQSWDTAISDEPTAAYSACTTWGVWGEKSEDELFRMMLLSSWRGRVGYPELRSRAQRLAKDYKDIGEHKNPMPAQRTVDICLIEAKATGDPLIRDLRLGGVPARGYTPKGDKGARVQRAAPLIECGLVYLPTEEKNPERITPMAEEFLETVITFPNGESKDLVDSMTQTILYLRDFDTLIHTSDVKEGDENTVTFRKLY
jgi:predicted phage terminase large subunit-like protein